MPEKNPEQNIICVIPARLASTRFPRKVLHLIHGKPLLQWVWEAACSIPQFSQVLIAVDASETARVVETFGGTWIMTSEQCISGTERLIETKNRSHINADVWVNWQADEPCIHPDSIEDLLQDCNHSFADIWTLKKQTTSQEEIDSSHTVKVVCDAWGHALYFSRSPIPYFRDESLKKLYYKHIGIYAFSAKSLLKIETFSSCDLEEAEKLEQLRFLYHGLKIKVHETQHETYGIDLPEHVALIEKKLLYRAKSQT